MQNQGISIFIVFLALFNLSGCITTEQHSTGFTKMRVRDTGNLEKEQTEKSTQYSVVAKLKSVNNQPQEFLNYKSKRFNEKSECETWLIENYDIVSVSISEQLRIRENGYFVENIKCTKISFLYNRISLHSMYI